MSKGSEFINRWMETVNRGDIEGLVEMCQPDVELANPEGTFHGPAGVRAAFEPVIAATSQRAVEIRSLIEDGDWLAVDFVFRFKNSGPPETPQGTTPATGRDVSLSSMGTYRLKDGKLAYSRGEYDRMGLLAQLGLLPAPEAVS